MNIENFWFVIVLRHPAAGADAAEDKRLYVLRVKVLQAARNNILFTRVGSYQTAVADVQHGQFCCLVEAEYGAIGIEDSESYAEPIDYHAIGRRRGADKDIGHCVHF